jgi:hypothetical protein
MLKILLVGPIFFLISLSQTALGSDAKWACVKDGKAIEIKGDTAKEKKEACETAKGKWTKDETKKEHAHGGGW